MGRIREAARDPGNQVCPLKQRRRDTGHGTPQGLGGRGHEGCRRRGCLKCPWHKEPSKRNWKDCQRGQRLLRGGLGSPHCYGPIDMQAGDCDFLVFSGYKIFSSHGSFLYGKGEHLRALQPYKVAPAPEYPSCKWEWGPRPIDVRSHTRRGGPFELAGQ